MIKKFIAGFIIFALASAVLKKYVIILIGLIVLLFIIRWVADIFWWGKDNEKW